MKRFLIAVFLLVVSGFVVCADTIGENFEGGGTILGGSGYLFHNLEGYWSASLDPYGELLIADGIAAGIGLGVYINSDGNWSQYVSPSASLVLGYDPDAKGGPAHQVGLSGGIGFSGTSGSGAAFDGGWLQPYYRFYYFIAPRIAPYVRVTAVTVNFGGGFSLSTYVRLAFGMSFHIPNKDQVIGGTGK